jgi:DNA-binding GntR family transcriptional regulator
MANMTARFKDVAARITQAILTGRLVPGTKLGERELGEVLDVSRIVVRQALIQLAEEGLVTIERNRGAFVTKPGMQDAIEIYEGLTLLEKGIVATLCERITPAGIAELRVHAERQRIATHESNDTFADHLGSEFHHVLVKLSRNRLLEDVHSQFVRRSQLLQALFPKDFDYCRLCEDHVKLVQLIERRQVKRAQDLIEEHYRTVLRGYHMEQLSVSPVSLETAFRQTQNTPAA